MIYRGPGFLAGSHDPASRPPSPPLHFSKSLFLSLSVCRRSKESIPQANVAWRPAKTILHRLAQSIPGLLKSLQIWPLEIWR
jgi:hypothetical protein